MLAQAFNNIIAHPTVYRLYGSLIQKALYITPSPEFNAHEVFPRLYVGDIFAAYNKIELKKRNITHVVTVILGIEPIYPEEFKYMNIHVRDLAREDLSTHFDEVVKFIDEGRTTGSVLVHCLRGISRSATVATAYVMQHLNITHLDAITMIKKTRQIVQPNSGFVKQLETYEIRLKGAHGESSNTADFVEKDYVKIVSADGEQIPADDANETGNCTEEITEISVNDLAREDVAVTTVVKNTEDKEGSACK